MKLFAAIQSSFFKIFFLYLYYSSPSLAAVVSSFCSEENPDYQFEITTNYVSNTNKKPNLGNRIHTNLLILFVELDKHVILGMSFVIRSFQSIHLWQQDCLRCFTRVSSIKASCRAGVLGAFQISGAQIERENSRENMLGMYSTF